VKVDPVGCKGHNAGFILVGRPVKQYNPVPGMQAQNDSQMPGFPVCQIWGGCRNLVGMNIKTSQFFALSEMD